MTVIRAHSLPVSVELMAAYIVAFDALFVRKAVLEEVFLKAFHALHQAAILSFG